MENFYIVHFQFLIMSPLLIFESRGVKLKEEDHGRMFPVSNKAQDVVDTLISTIKTSM